jgi:hypothetical protein
MIFINRMEIDEGVSAYRFDIISKWLALSDKLLLEGDILRYLGLAKIREGICAPFIQIK